MVKLVVTPEQAISVRLPSGEDRVIPFDPSSTLAQCAREVRLDTRSRFPLVAISVLDPATGNPPKHLLPSFIASDKRTLAEVPPPPPPPPPPGQESVCDLYASGGTP